MLFFILDTFVTVLELLRVLNALNLHLIWWNVHNEIEICCLADTFIQSDWTPQWCLNSATLYCSFCSIPTDFNNFSSTVWWSRQSHTRNPRSTLDIWLTSVTVVQCFSSVSEKGLLLCMLLGNSPGNFNPCLYSCLIVCSASFYCLSGICGWKGSTALHVSLVLYESK